MDLSTSTGKESSAADASFRPDLTVLEFDWHIPWEAGWTQEKKFAAAERLCGYMTKGTFFETTSRARVVEARVVQHTPSSGIFVRLRLER